VARNVFAFLAILVYDSNMSEYICYQFKFYEPHGKNTAEFTAYVKYGSVRIEFLQSRQPSGADAWCGFWDRSQLVMCIGERIRQEMPWVSDKVEPFISKDSNPRLDRHRTVIFLRELDPVDLELFVAKFAGEDLRIEQVNY